MMKDFNQHIYNARSIGSVALEILSKVQGAFIFGKTSNGVYIKTSSKWLVFISFDQFRGPLIITLNEDNPGFQHISPGKPIKITSQALSFPGLNMEISLIGSEVWQPQSTSTLLNNNLVSHERLIRFINEALRVKKGEGFSNLLTTLIGFLDDQDSHLGIRIFDMADIEELQKYLWNGEVDPTVRLLTNVLGSGPGLTPSADDFCLGLLLTLNRWQNSCWTAAGLREMNDQVVQAAYAKTTRLSANLIECATLGLADERLLNALDWLVTGVAREPEIIIPLLDWGQSSGMAALTGMAVVLLAVGQWVL